MSIKKGIAMENGSLGFIEITGVVAALDALDIMVKSANVSLVSWERKLGGRLVTMIITGDVAAVQEAVDNACRRAIKKPVAHLVIAAPHEETWKMVKFSAKRLQKGKNDKNSEETSEGYQEAYF